jgi:hypothetical protein
LAAALTQRTNYELGEVAEGEARFYRASMPAGGKATMAFQLRGFWPNYPASSPPPLTFTQSNLNLRQYTSAGAEIPPPTGFDAPMASVDAGPDAVDPNDTVEQVRAPSAQTITFKVESASEIDGAAAEPFAIAAAAGLTPLTSPVTRPTDSTATPSTTVGCDEPVTVETELTNDSDDLESSESAVSIELPPGIVLTSGSQTQTVSGGTLEPSTTSETKAWTVEATTDGPHTITIVGVGEGLGTPFRRSQTFQVTSDCVAPETTIDSGPSRPTNNSSPSFGFSATESPVGFECSIDGGVYSACTRGMTTGPLADGQHIFSVRARDAVGNVDPTPSTRSFLVDTVAPDTTITSGPPRRTKATPSFTFTANDDSTTFECRVDGGAPTRCTSPFAAPGLRDGPHAFAVGAVDAAGNRDPLPTSWEFVTDTHAEHLSLGASRKQSLRDPLTVRVTVDADERGTVVITGQLLGTDGRLMRTRTSVSPRRTARLSIDATRAAARRVKRMVRREEPVRFLVDARFRDDAGNPDRDQVRVRIRP